MGGRVDLIALRAKAAMLAPSCIAQGVTASKTAIFVEAGSQRIDGNHEGRDCNTQDWPSGNSGPRNHAQGGGTNADHKPDHTDASFFEQLQGRTTPKQVHRSAS